MKSRPCFHRSRPVDGSKQRRYSRAIVSLLTATAVTFLSGCAMEAEQDSDMRDSPRSPQASDLQQNASDQSAASAEQLLISPKELADCHSGGQMLNRTSRQCFGTLMPKESCDRSWIEEAFVQTGIQIEEVLNQSLEPSDASPIAFAIDQCGFDESGKPVAWLIRVEEGAAGPELRVRKLST